MFEKKSVLVELPVSLCVLDAIADMGSKAADGCAFFLSESAVKNLISSEGAHFSFDNGELTLTWKATESFPKTKLCMQESGFSTWKTITRIDAADIKFQRNPADPKYLIFLTVGDDNFEFKGILGMLD